MFYYGLALLILSAIPAYLITRRETAFLTQLKQLANEILSGKEANRLRITKDNEFSDIATVLNVVIDSSANNKYKFDWTINCLY